MLDGNGSNQLNFQLLMVEESVLGTRYKTTVQQFLNQAYRFVQFSNVTLENPRKNVDIIQKNSLLIPYWQIMENSSRIFSEIFIFRVVTQAVLLENSSIRIFWLKTYIIYDM